MFVLAEEACLENKILQLLHSNFKTATFATFMPITAVWSTYFHELQAKQCSPRMPIIYTTPTHPLLRPPVQDFAFLCFSHVLSQFYQDRASSAGRDLHYSASLFPTGKICRSRYEVHYTIAAKIITCENKKHCVMQFFTYSKLCVEWEVCVMWFLRIGSWFHDNFTM